MAKKTSKKKATKRYAPRSAKSREASSRPKAARAGQAAQEREAVPALKLGSLAREGVKAIEVHFRGCDDDGNFKYKTKPKEIDLSDDARRRIEGLLTGCFSVYGECEGSVLIGQLDLENGLWTGYSGSGTAKARLAELIHTLELNGVQSLVAEVKSGAASKTSVKPPNSEEPSDSQATINWFLRRLRDYFIESEGYVADEEKAEAAIDQHAWEASVRTLKIDVVAKGITLSGSGIASPITATAVMARAQRRFRLSE